VYTLDGECLKDGAMVGEGNFVGLVLDKSSFYVEGRGQYTNTGTI
jgi:alanyl-tRNA synthetase